MNNNLRMSGTMFLMLKKSADRRQREALEQAFKVCGWSYLFGTEDSNKREKMHGS